MNDFGTFLLLCPVVGFAGVLAVGLTALGAFTAAAIVGWLFRTLGLPK